MAHPVHVDGVASQKGNARTFFPLVLDNAAALQALDDSGAWVAFILSNQGWYRKRPSDTTTADDGASCIRDAAGVAWKHVSFGVGGDLFDAYGLIGGSPSGRDAFDAEAEGFTFFATDTERWYVRSSETPGTWAGPFLFQGPAGDIEITGTSTTSLTIGTGNKVFTTQADIAWPSGTRLRAASAANPTTHWMEGVVSAYSGTSLTITVDKTGSGLGDTRGDWNLFLAGEPGGVGPTGPNVALDYQWNTATSADPGNGKARGDNADPTLITSLALDDVDRNATNHEALIQQLDNSTTPGNLATIYVIDVANRGNWIAFRQTAVWADQTGYWTAAVTYLDHAGTIANDAIIAVLILPTGDKGDAGTQAVGTVTTGEPGSNASFVNVGSGHSAVWNVSIPRGDPGRGFQPHFTVETLAERDQYDTEPVIQPNGYQTAVLVLMDDGSPATLDPFVYFLLEPEVGATPAVWSEPVRFTPSNTAADVAFDPTGTNLESVTTQAAIVEVHDKANARIDAIPDPVAMAIIFAG